MQFDLLVSNGLKPHHYLLDIACGSLRGGVYFIPYLESGHYLGIDKEADLIRAGIDQELAPELYREKKPQLLVSDSFEFDRFTALPDYALAQSLFTHVPPQVIIDCFQKLRTVIREHGEFYATFFETAEPRANPETPHDHAYFAYSRDEMIAFGSENGWRTQYIGDWGHPRRQVLVRYLPS